MVRRLYRTVALAVVAGTLSLLNALPAQSGTVTSVIENNSFAQPAVANQRAVENKTAVNKQTGGRTEKRKGQHISEFVALSYLILDDSFVPDIFFTSISSLDPMVVDRTFGANAAGWPAGTLRSGHDRRPAKNFFFSVLPITPATINIQPLAIGKACPAFGNFVTISVPHLRMLSFDDMFVPGETLDFADNSVFDTVTEPKEIRKNTPGNTAKSSKSPFSYSYKKDKMSLNTGISWINDLADFRGLSQTFQKAGFDSTADKVSGVNLNLGASYRAFSLTGGYIRALERYAPTQQSFTGNETEPGAWSSELAYATELLSKETVLAVGYQKSSESLRLYLPEQRYVTKASMAIFDGTTLSLEYYRDKDYSVENGGVNGDSYGFITKIGVEFQVDR